MQFHQKLLKILLVCSSRHLPNSLPLHWKKIIFPPILNMIILHHFIRKMTIPVTNYRPISIRPSISKIFERLMFKQITTYVSNLLSPYLCGFRKGYNAQNVLLRLKKQTNKCLDKKECVGLFMMDLSKAFDCIPQTDDSKTACLWFRKKMLVYVSDFSSLLDKDESVTIHQRKYPCISIRNL